MSTLRHIFIFYYCKNPTTLIKYHEQYKIFLEIKLKSLRLIYGNYKNVLSGNILQITWETQNSNPNELCYKRKKYVVIPPIQLPWENCNSIAFRIAVVWYPFFSSIFFISRNFCIFHGGIFRPCKFFCFYFFY